jgi:hypothetical protein
VMVERVLPHAAALLGVLVLALLLIALALRAVLLPSRPAGPVRRWKRS